VGVKDGTRLVGISKGMIVPGCGDNAITSPALRTSILTHTCAKEGGPKSIFGNPSGFPPFFKFRKKTNIMNFPEDSGVQ